MRSTIILAVLAALVTTASAQDQKKEQRTPEQRAQALTDRMKKDLGLSDDQALKVEAINRKFAEQGEAMRAEREKQRETMRKEGEGRRKALREGHEAELSTVLSPDQLATWQKRHEELKARRTDRRGEMKQRREDRELKEEKH